MDLLCRVKLSSCHYKKTFNESLIHLGRKKKRGTEVSPPVAVINRRVIYPTRASRSSSLHKYILFPWLPDRLSSVMKSSLEEAGVL